jgi:hypothetical protein
MSRSPIGTGAWKRTVRVPMYAMVPNKTGKHHTSHSGRLPSKRRGRGPETPDDRPDIRSRSKQSPPRRVVRLGFRGGTIRAGRRVRRRGPCRSRPAERQQRRRTGPPETRAHTARSGARPHGSVAGIGQALDVPPPLPIVYPRGGTGSDRRRLIARAR